jgi:pyrimidine-nucleoside phosphorylase
VDTYTLIKRKRDGGTLSREMIDHLVGGLVNGSIPDSQVSAFLTSVYFQGMNDRECFDLTMAMAASGDTVDLSPIRGFKVDKHSTGGVGDKTTLVLAPLVAACGGIVPKMSGRELAHTGGTVDKLESIPGMKTTFTTKEFIDIASRVHVSIIGQTERLAPADKQMYALRNLTATVDSIPLIASSVMSKKLAAGADGIVLDVKTGSGAFMPDFSHAAALARTMVKIGREAGKKVVALISAMGQPLGNAVGNAVEVKEAIDTLAGDGPDDLLELVLTLGSHMLLISEAADTLEDARRKLLQGIREGRGLEKMAEFIEAQGGSPEVVKDTGLLPQPDNRLVIPSGNAGTVQRVNALNVGKAAKILGAGRRAGGGHLDHSIGIIVQKKVGDRVERGEPLAVLLSDGDPRRIEPARDILLDAYEIGEQPVEAPRLCLAVLTGDGMDVLPPPSTKRQSEWHLK